MANAQKTQSNDAANKGSADQSTQNSGTTNQNAGSGSQLADQVSNIVSGDTGAIKDVLSQAKESTGQVASQAYGAAAQKATSVIDEQKTTLAQGLTSVADSIRQMGNSLRSGQEVHGVVDVTAKYSDSIATQVEQFSHYLEAKDLRQLASDVERFARRNPAVFLGGTFALGLLAARFLKSGNSNQALMRRERYEREGVYLPDEHEGVHLPENLDAQSTPANRNNITSGATGATDTMTGTSGTTNTTTGSSNQGG
jgi:hypothetical protein